jgi:hypothetical protein
MCVVRFTPTTLRCDFEDEPILRCYLPLRDTVRDLRDGPQDRALVEPREALVSEAANKGAAVHREAHGLVADENTEVTEGSV